MQNSFLFVKRSLYEEVMLIWSLAQTTRHYIQVGPIGFHIKAQSIGWRGNKKNDVAMYNQQDSGKYTQ